MVQLASAVDSVTVEYSAAETHGLEVDQMVTKAVNVSRLDMAEMAVGRQNHRTPMVSALVSRIAEVKLSR